VRSILENGYKIPVNMSDTEERFYHYLVVNFGFETSGSGSGESNAAHNGLLGEVQHPEYDGRRRRDETKEATFDRTNLGRFLRTSSRHRKSGRFSPREPEISEGYFRGRCPREVRGSIPTIGRYREPITII
jgi:hypothetical protein